MRTHSIELAAWLRQRHRVTVASALLRRGFVVLALLVAGGVIASLFGFRMSRTELVLWISGGLAGCLAVSLTVAPSRLDPEREDAELGAHDALATLLLGSGAAASCELLDRSVVVLTQSAAQHRRQSRLRRKLVLWAAVLAVVLLLAILVLPGHTPTPGTGIAAGGGAAAAPVAAIGHGRGTAGHQSRAKNHDTKPNDTKQDTEPDPSRTPRNNVSRAPHRVKTLVVFPDFRDGARRSERETPEIERAPRGVAAPRRAGRSRAAAKGPPTPAIEHDWKRQLERALDRGSLAPWEGRWLELYGRALDREARGK